MSFEMESEKHAINMTYAPVHGLTIIGLTCPHEKKFEAMKNHVNNFQYDWITNDDIADWYGNLQKIIQVCSEKEKGP